MARAQCRRHWRGGGNEPREVRHREGGGPSVARHRGVRGGWPQSLEFLRDDKQGVFIGEERSDEAIHLVLLCHLPRENHPARSVTQ